MQVRPVTRPSDVTDWWTTVANPGSSAAAGVVPGAPYLRFSAGGRRRDSNAAEWECGLSRSSPMARRMPLQGSGGPFVYGARFEVNLSWAPPCPERSPRDEQVSRKLAPAHETGPLSDRKNQHPANRSFELKDRRDAVTAVRLGELQPGDLRSPDCLNELHEQAVDAGWISASEADRLRFFAAARHACRDGIRNPAGLFVATVREQRWRMLTLAEEEWARRALGQVRASAAVSAATDQADRRLTELVTMVAGSLTLSRFSERAKARTADAVPKKNWAVSEHPAVSSSTAITSNASISDSTLSASAA